VGVGAPGTGWGRGARVQAPICKPLCVRACVFAGGAAYTEKLLRLAVGCPTSVPYTIGCTPCHMPRPHAAAAATCRLPSARRANVRVRAQTQAATQMCGSIASMQKPSACVHVLAGGAVYTEKLFRLSVGCPTSVPYDSLGGPPHNASDERPSALQQVTWQTDPQQLALRQVDSTIRGHGTGLTTLLSPSEPSPLETHLGAHLASGPRA
jgi:hypothetical protein